MGIGRRSLWLLVIVELCAGACSSSSTSSGGTYGTGGTGGSGTGGTGGESGSGGSSGSGNSDAASGSDVTSDGSRCVASGATLHVVNQDSSAYVFDGGSPNAPITLCRGSKYTFSINAPGHPFFIRQDTMAFTTGVTGNFTQSGDLVFDVPSDAPSMLFYQCNVHPVMTGPIAIVD